MAHAPGHSHCLSNTWALRFVAVVTGLAAILLHFAFLFFNILATWLLRFPEKERKAIIVMASQKNLPTAAGGFSLTQWCVGASWELRCAATASSS